jgi:hypothetical protein
MANIPAAEQSDQQAFFWLIKIKIKIDEHRRAQSLEKAPKRKKQQANLFACTIYSSRVGGIVCGNLVVFIIIKASLEEEVSGWF